MTHITQEDIMALKRIEAPWSQAMVDHLNAYQKVGLFHPYTCGGERMDQAHQDYAYQHEGDYGQMIATTDGWVCPVCDYRQTWAHVFGGIE